MAKIDQMMRLLICSLLLACLSSCIPDRLKEKVDEGIAEAQKILADQEFKKAIAQVEMHKLRNGQYPNSLSELKFLAPMDSTIFTSTEYTKLDSGYELNIKMDFPSFNDGMKKEIDLHYPPEFWQGLGCVKSNTK